MGFFVAREELLGSFAAANRLHEGGAGLAGTLVAGQGAGVEPAGENF